MTFLVAVTAMDECVLAEDVADRAPERLAAVDHEQDRLLGIEAAVDQVGEQRPREGRVLRGAFPEPERDLDAVGADPERDDVGALGDLQPVDHHHRQAHVFQPARHQIAESSWRVRSTNISDTDVFDVAEHDCSTSLPTRLADLRVLARRDAGEHPVHHRPRERVTIGEVLVRLHRQLALVIGRAHPRPAHRDAAAAQRQRPVLVAVTLRRPVRVVLALRAHNLLDLELHQLVHDAEPNTDAQREQPFPRRTDELAQRFLDLRRQRTLRRRQGRDDLRRGYLLHGGSSCPRGLG